MKSKLASKSPKSLQYDRKDVSIAPSRKLEAERGCVFFFLEVIFFFFFPYLTSTTVTDQDELESRGSLIGHCDLKKKWRNMGGWKETGRTRMTTFDGDWWWVGGGEEGREGE